MTPPGRFDGVVKIVRFNIGFYALSVGGLLGVGVLLALHVLPHLLAVALACGAALMAFWTVSSLVVSYWVYDHAGVTRWQWLPAALPFQPRRWVNVHAGLDESTASLKVMLPGTESLVVDIYDAEEMTEPSIARARRLHPATEPFVAARLDALPLPDHDRDTAFLLFAAHEVRQAGRRTKFLREVARVLSDAGQVVLVEHLRDWKNFVAFGPGFLHFHSEWTWRRDLQQAGLAVRREQSVTPFVRCFVLGKVPDRAGA